MGDKKVISQKSHHLSNEEEAEVLPDFDDEEATKVVSNCLVGKFWMDKSFNIKAFMNTIRGMWGFHKGVEIKELGKNLFIFQFTLKRDK